MRICKITCRHYVKLNIILNASIFSADIISTVQFNHDGEFLATGDKGGRVVIFQKDLGVSFCKQSLSTNIFKIVLSISISLVIFSYCTAGSNKTLTYLHFQSKGEYSVYSTFQSHEPQFDYLKSLEIEEKINEIQWLKRQNNNLFLLSTNGKYSFNSFSSFETS